jgi:tRNA dimethylallyltransferase
MADAATDPAGDPDAIVITGATATGKTAVAVAVAHRVDGEIISLDSRQLYRGMDIGTAKPLLEERGGVPHHGFDLVDPDERFNAGRFAEFARATMHAVLARGHVPILAGGTGFFLRALTHPLFDEPPLDEGRKERLKRYLADLETEELRRWTAGLGGAAEVRPSDRQRHARMIEVALLTGRPLSWWHRHGGSSAAAIAPLVFVLDLPRDVLVRRIDARVDAMVARGLVAEVGRLLERGFDETHPGLNTTGYIELVPYLRGERGLEEAVEMVKVATRRYARRQRTWLRQQLPPGARWLDAGLPAAQVADTIVDAWREAVR